MLTTMRAWLLTTVSIIVVACGGGATTTSPTPTAATAPPSPSGGGFGAIEHATGATDVLLRFEQGGGFVAPGFLVTQAPIFTLYGDGTVIFRNPALDPLPLVGSVSPLRPFRTAKLDEDQIQAVLEDALGRGGLGAARTEYTDAQIADAPTATFTVNAGGLSKKVSVYALGIDVQESADAPARAAFQGLAERLQDFDKGGTFSTAEYAPDRYRGVLMDGGPGAVDAVPWPWDDIAPADFQAHTDPGAFPIPTHVLTVAQAEALGIKPYRGGLQGLTLVSDDGATHAFSLRPLLPDEQS
jgi:hypothetical protein